MSTVDMLVDTWLFRESRVFPLGKRVNGCIASTVECLLYKGGCRCNTPMVGFAFSCLLFVFAFFSSLVLLRFSCVFHLRLMSSDALEYV